MVAYMAMNDLDWNLGYLLTGYLESIEYECQYEFNHQIIAEASAAQSEETKEKLQALLNNTRVRLDVNGNSLSVDLFYLNVPEGMEDYAEMLEENARIVTEIRVKDMVEDYLEFSDVREKIYGYVNELVVDHLRSAIGGVTQ